MLTKLQHARTLIEEPTSFQVKITDTGHHVYGAWREGAHDDLVQACGTGLLVWRTQGTAARIAAEASRD